MGNLYFIAIIPPKEICDSIIAIQSEFVIHFGSKAALKVIPHITIKAPFKLPVSAHPELEKWFLNLSIPIDPFQVELGNFGAFANKKHPVIYIHPVINPSLVALHNEITHRLELSFPELKSRETHRDFNPHVTVAFKDLSSYQFREAWKLYQSKEYRAVFVATQIHLLHHDGSRWNVIASSKNFSK
jgi:2'-5' RNA ligase